MWQYKLKPHYKTVSSFYSTDSVYADFESQHVPKNTEQISLFIFFLFDKQRLLCLHALLWSAFYMCYVYILLVAIATNNF